MVNFLVEPKKGAKWPKTLPRFTSRQEAIAVCKELCKEQFIHRSEKIGKGQLDVSTRMTTCGKNLVCNLLVFLTLLIPLFAQRYLETVILMKLDSLLGFMKEINHLVT